MESFEGIWDFAIEKIDADIMDTKERGRIEKLISQLKMYKDDPKKLTEIYTSILKEPGVVKTLTKISQSPEFYEKFPEFFIDSELGENVINCQQNSQYHKYGVFRHTLEAINYVGTCSMVPFSDYEMKILKWTMLLHDIGKPFVKTVSEQGNDSFPGHEDVSYDMAGPILDRFEFLPDEKEIILKLIKYHDKFINQGEIIYDNMKLLASELGNNKKIFNLLLEVKEADAKAKSDEVYETYKSLKPKYIEFMGSYFSYGNSTSETVNVMAETVDVNVQSVNEEYHPLDAALTNDQYETILNDTINRKYISVYYQPIIDLSAKRVTAYETFSKIEQPQSVPILDLLNYSKQVGKFDKIQQVLMINSITEFEKVQSKESSTVFVNVDYESYDKYINKPRLYDMMQRNKIVLEFQNYSNIVEADLQFAIKTIKQHGGLVSLDNFGTANESTGKISILQPNFVKLDVSFLNNISVDSEKQNYLINVVKTCSNLGVEVIAMGVEDRATLITLKNLGVRYVQGYFFDYPSKSIRIMNKDVENIVDSINNENSL